MTKLSEAPATEFIKMFYVGDSKSGKTGSLVSLVKEGFKLRILDMDNGVNILRAYIKRECPDKIDNVDVESFHDKMKVDQTGKITPSMSTKAFTDAIKLLDKWTDGTVPAEWGPETFFVLDTLNTFGQSALKHAMRMAPTAKDPRQWYWSAQQDIEFVVSMLMSQDFKTNVIINSHITPAELESGVKKGFPATGAGTAAGPAIAKWCNNLIMAETVGVGTAMKKVIRTTPTTRIDLATEAPFATLAEYELGTGLAEIVKTLRANQA